jgi:hypothetical protein
MDRVERVDDLLLATVDVDLVINVREVVGETAVGLSRVSCWPSEAGVGGERRRFRVVLEQRDKLPGVRKGLVRCTCLPKFPAPQDGASSTAEPREQEHPTRETAQRASAASLKDGRSRCSPSTSTRFVSALSELIMVNSRLAS